jgi:hypothetical protein
MNYIHSLLKILQEYISGNMTLPDGRASLLLSILEARLKAQTT